MPALEWVLTKLGKSPDGEWNFTSEDWRELIQNDTTLTINTTNLTVIYLEPEVLEAPTTTTEEVYDPSGPGDGGGSGDYDPYDEEPKVTPDRRRLHERKLSETLPSSTVFNVHGKMNYYKELDSKYIEVIMAPESLLYVLDIIGANNGMDDWYSEERFRNLRSRNDMVYLTRDIDLANMFAKNVTVNGRVKVDGQLDTIGQMNSFGNVDFWPGGDMFSFERTKLRKTKSKHYQIKNGLPVEDGSECKCII